MGAKASLVCMDEGINVEWIGEDIGRGKAFVHPLAAVLDLHDAADDFAIDDRGEREGFLCGTDILAIGGVVGH